MQNSPTGKSKFKTFALRLWHTAFTVLVLCSSAWLCLALWMQEPISWLFSRIAIGAWTAFALCVLGIYASHIVNRSLDAVIYIVAFLLTLGWYFSLEAKQDRDWNPEVAQMLHYEKNGNHVTLHNVRNFDWHKDGSYTEHWETRQFDLNQITGVSIITSYWMGPKIAHTLVSFDFANAKPLTFSIEIRKEKGEDFSAIGGFFRKYELSLIAADEKDIIYTRSNTRGEQVYFFPVQMAPAARKALFEEYLSKIDDLNAEPKWYNTLTSNCTTLVFDMAQAVNQHQLPVDYRLLASGYLPNYLYDLNAISHQWNITQWYQQAHVNPKVQKMHSLSSSQYSTLLREGLPLDTQNTAP